MPRKSRQEQADESRAGLLSHSEIPDGILAGAEVIPVQRGAKIADDRII